ncbi:uncharacterized protein UBRO_01685 [Ustilago bromivora]|uniref:Uncharacterized protein n=1 Tax=Ustilago bromivora TaxID=307758 RepID=A0A1K0GL36_9BASI|nr:uncharacterized protein UBRO_01685 [Ustilago bromivora]SYW78186.1 uncharacterized protein UBRO2_02378 [Ustilago bromivora]
MHPPDPPPTAEEGDDDLETYLFLLLSDSNLPTGGFVASSGLESFFAHGLLHNSRFNLPPPTSSSSSKPASGRVIAPSQAQLSSATLSFAKSTLHSYARSSFPFVARVHYAVIRYLNEAKGEELEECLSTISRLDYSYHTLLLNHVARRASKAQGIALLTLYSKAFARPINLSSEPFDGSPLAYRSSASCSTTEELKRIELAAALVDKLKQHIRQSTSSSGREGEGRVEKGCQHGHLPICWAVFSACLGLSLEKAVYLHLFLQARSLFSSSVRLGTLGPYMAHQVMRFQLRAVVEDLLGEIQSEGLLTIPNSSHRAKGKQKAEEVEGYTIDPYPTAPSLKKEEKVKAFRTTATMCSNANVKGKGKVGELRTGKGQLIPVDDNEDTDQGWAWDWPEDPDPLHQPNSDGEEGRDSEIGFWTSDAAPATTFPLGEIVQARHDCLHSRLFNS